MNLQRELYQNPNRQIKFIFQYNSDLNKITNEMLEFLEENEVEEEWVMAIMAELALCNVTE